MTLGIDLARHLAMEYCQQQNFLQQQQQQKQSTETMLTTTTNDTSTDNDNNNRLKSINDHISATLAKCHNNKDRIAASEFVCLFVCFVVLNTVILRPFFVKKSKQN